MFKKIFTSMLAVLLIVALACSMIACDGGSSKKDSKKSVEPSEEAFKDAYSEAVKEALTGIDKYYSNVDSIDTNNLGMTTSTSVNLSSELLNILSSFVPYDLSWINDVKINNTDNFKGDLLSASTSILYNGNESASATYIFDMASKCVYMSIPALSNVALKMDMSEMGDIDEAISILELISSIDLAAVLPDKTALKGLLSDISNAIINSIEDVDFDETTINVNGVSQDCVEYVVEISTKDLVNVAVNVLKKLQGNKNVETIVRDLWGTVSNYADEFGLPIDSYTPEMITSMLNTYIGEALTMINENTASIPDMKLGEWTSYITDELEIIGVEFNVDLSTFIGKASNAIVSILTATDGSDIGFEMSVTAMSTTYAQILGDFTKKGNAISGTADIQVLGSTYAIIELANVDTSKEYFTGAVTISPSATLLDMVKSRFGSELASIGLNLANPGIKFDVQQNDGKTAKIALSIINNGSALATFNVETGIGTAGNITIPSSTNNNPESWSESLSAINLINKANSLGLPPYIVELLWELEEELN